MFSLIVFVGCSNKMSVEELRDNIKNHLKEKYGGYFVKYSLKGENHTRLTIKFNDKFDKLSPDQQEEILTDIENYFDKQWNRLQIKEPSDKVLSDPEKESKRIKDIVLNYTPYIYVDTPKWHYYKTIDGEWYYQNKIASYPVNTNQTNDDGNQLYLSDSDILKVWNIAKNAVKERLKSPSSAKFPQLVNNFVQSSGDKINVFAYVDAKNDFGTMIRSQFLVVLDKNFNVESVDIEK